MNQIPTNQKISMALRLGLALACFWVGLAVVPVGAEGQAKRNTPTSTAQKDSGLSTDTLQKQITELDGQIQKLREQSLELQEKTQAKLQAQLEFLKQERDTLIPRIEKLRDNSELAWQDIKENIQKAIEDLNASVLTMKE